MLNVVVVLSAIIYLSTSSRFYTYKQCPELCICSPSFTDCKSNNLTDLPTNLDQNVSLLDLAYNNFQQFPKQLNNYPTLVNLNLSHNGIYVIQDLSFFKLKKLEKLDLNSNMFTDWTSIGQFAFSKATSLWFLDMSNNPLSGMPKERNVFQIISLKILRLINCSIMQFNNKILETLPFLEELHLSNNPIKHLNPNFKSTSLKFLDLSGCQLQNIDYSIFTQLTSLQTIYMSRNTNLRVFNCDSLSLEYLDLSNCNIEMVPNGNLPNLYMANFSENRFRNIPANAFQNYTQLTYLDLSYNSISTIELNSFKGSTNIKEIDLSKNRLHDLSSNLFDSNENLLKLNLSRNYINSFTYMVSKTLEELDLSFCEIVSIRYDSLMQLPSLRRLYLSRNTLSILPEFWKTETLTMLDVSFCRIKNLSNKTFSQMPSLRSLNLAGNRLTSAPADGFVQVMSLDISDNPWRCDCVELKELYSWLSNTGKSLSSLYCQSPDIYEGKSWLTACETDWYPMRAKTDTLWWYTTGLIVGVFIILFVILALRRIYALKEKRVRQANAARRNEEREALRRMQRLQQEMEEQESHNAPDPRDLQSPPCYSEALLLPKLDSSHPSLAGSLHSLASKHSLNGSSTDVSKRNRPRRKRRRRKSDSFEGQRASRVVVESETSDSEIPQPRTTLESDF